MQRSEIVIYFDEDKHEYTDIVGNTYISSTTIVGEYTHKFSEKESEIAGACARIGKNPNHPKYLKYKGQTKQEILQAWEDKRNNACDIGNRKHNYLEDTIKFSNNYKYVYGDRDTRTKILYTIEDILLEHDYGIVDIDKLKEMDMDTKYPKIFRTLVAFINLGWKLYSEIAVFDPDKLISGLIDLLAVKDKDFMIIDWKTNEAPIRFEAGYYDKDNDGNRTDSFIFKKPDADDKYFKAPLGELEQSTGNKMALQLSIYAFLVEQRGFKFVGAIIFHIRHHFYNAFYEESIEDRSLIGKNVVDVVSIPYLRDEVIAMFNDYEQQRYNGKFMLKFN